jgi:hypothetical protein
MRESSTIHHSGRDPRDLWGIARREPEWRHELTAFGLIRPGRIVHIRSGQVLRATPRGWTPVTPDKPEAFVDGKTASIGTESTRA